MADQKITQLTEITDVQETDMIPVVDLSGTPTNKKATKSTILKRSLAVLFVAASNASDKEKARADYLCDGTDDDVQIQAALDALEDGVGVVELSSGDFSTGNTINITTGQTLRGQGIGATNIQADAATFHTIHMGNRQSDGIMRNWMGLEEMNVSAAGGANNYDAVWVDGGGNGTHIINVKANEGKYNFRLTDIDQSYFTGIKGFNPRTASIYCEVGLENTWGNVAFYSPAVALSDNNSVGWLFSNNANQSSPNRFDRISIYGGLFFSTSGLTGTVGLQMAVGATAFTIIGSLFESNIHQISLDDETQLTLIGCSFIQNSGVSTNIVRLQNDNHSVTIQDCRLQQATNAFNGVSGFPKLCFLGRSTNQGNISNMFTGTFGAKQGTDTVFAGDNALASGLDNEKYDYGFFNNLVATLIKLGGVDITASAAEINILDGATLSTTELNYVDGVTSAIQTQLDAKSTASKTETLTNKTINANGTGNSITNIEVADLASGVLDTDLSSVSGSDDTIPSAKATKTALDTKLAATSPAVGIDLGAILSSNGTYKGITITGTVDTNGVGFGAVLAQAADFHWDEDDADAIANCYGLAMAVETGTGSKILILQGQVCNTAWNWSAGNIYLSTTQGTITQTPPSGTDDCVVYLGFALSADTIYFNPSGVIVEHA